MTDKEKVKTSLEKAVKSGIISFKDLTTDIVQFHIDDLFEYKEQAEVLVNNIPFTKSKLENCGALCKAFCQQFITLNKAFKHAIPLELEIRCNFVENKYIFHTKVEKYAEERGNEDVRKAVRCILKWTDHFKRESLALTPIGCGKACRYDSSTVAEAFNEEINAYFLFHPHSTIKKIYIVTKDPVIFFIMKTAFKNVECIDDFMKFNICSLNKSYDLITACTGRPSTAIPHPPTLDWGELDTVKNREEKLEKLIALSSHVPKDWHAYSGLLTQSVKIESEKIDLHLKQPDLYKNIEKIILKTWKSKYVACGNDSKDQDASLRNIQVKKIYRYENPSLFHKYSVQKSDLMRHAIDNSIDDFDFEPVETFVNAADSIKSALVTDVNEHFLFHGTGSSIINSILDANFDHKWSSDTPMFGHGVYFSESATKADQYVGTGTSHTIILARVLMGSTYHATQPIGGKRKPPLRPSTGNKKLYDSVIGTNRRNGDRLNFREFIVFKDDYYYPEYLIEYERCSD